MIKRAKSVVKSGVRYQKKNILYYLQSRYLIKIKLKIQGIIIICVKKSREGQEVIL